jgi:hypothetical protein
MNKQNQKTLNSVLKEIKMTPQTPDKLSVILKKKHDTIKGVWTEANPTVLEDCSQIEAECFNAGLAEGREMLKEGLVITKDSASTYEVKYVKIGEVDKVVGGIFEQDLMKYIDVFTHLKDKK